MKKTQANKQLDCREDYYDWIVSTGPMYAVVYLGQTFQLRKEHCHFDLRKYVPTTSTQRGTSERLARRLNALYHTQEFKVVEIQPKTP